MAYEAGRSLNDDGSFAAGQSAAIENFISLPGSNSLIPLQSSQSAAQITKVILTNAANSVIFLRDRNGPWINPELRVYGKVDMVHNPATIDLL